MWYLIDIIYVFKYVYKYSIMQKINVTYFYLFISYKVLMKMMVNITIILMTDEILLYDCLIV